MSKIYVNNIKPLSGNKVTIGNIGDNVELAGSLDFDNISSVDSIGIITAQSGIDITAGGMNVTGVVTASSGISANNINVTGVVTSTGGINANGMNVTGVVTSTGGINVNGINATGIITASGINAVGVITTQSDISTPYIDNISGVVTATSFDGAHVGIKTVNSPTESCSFVSSASTSLLTFIPAPADQKPRWADAEPTPGIGVSVGINTTTPNGGLRTLDVNGTVRVALGGTFMHGGHYEADHSDKNDFHEMLGGQSITDSSTITNAHDLSTGTPVMPYFQSGNGLVKKWICGAQNRTRHTMAFHFPPGGGMTSCLVKFTASYIKSTTGYAGVAYLRFFMNNGSTLAAGTQAIANNSNFQWTPYVKQYQSSDIITELDVSSSITELEVVTYPGSTSGSWYGVMHVELVSSRRGDIHIWENG